jgi:sporulation protein YlmC with PRC-barrel domain
MSRLEGALDAALHLLDRQVVDKDGLAVCKVDDVELTENRSGTLEVTGLLAGAPALVPRYGGRHGGILARQWRRLGIEQTGRDVPRHLPLDLVDNLGSAVELRVGREAVLRQQVEAGAGTTHRRLGELLEMEVRAVDGSRHGGVIDVRLDQSTREPLGRLLVVGLLVGRGRPGSMLGYDRKPDQGPWLVNRAVSWLHRHTGYVDWADVSDIDWDASVITVTTSTLTDLGPA